MAHPRPVHRAGRRRVARQPDDWIEIAVGPDGALTSGASSSGAKNPVRQ
jgi:hypothetical protein